MSAIYTHKQKERLCSCVNQRLETAPRLEASGLQTSGRFRGDPYATVSALLFYCLPATEFLLEASCIPFKALACYHGARDSEFQFFYTKQCAVLIHKATNTYILCLNLFIVCTIAR